MKRILTGTLSLVLFFGAAQAQDSTNHSRGGRQQMAQQLNLNGDQQKKMQAIGQQERTEMKAIHDKYQSQRMALLTPDQQQKFQALKADRKNGMLGNRGPGHRPFGNQKAAGKRAELMKDLNLTQSQKDQLSKMRADTRTQVQSVRNDQSLTQDQKKEKLHSIMKDQKEKFKSVLTKEQQDKLDASRKEHKDKLTK